MISWAQMDVTQADSVRDVLSQIIERDKPSAVVYCVSAGETSVGAYQNAYDIGVRNTIASLPEETRLIFVSSTGVYHENSGEIVDESTPTDARLLSETQRFLLTGESSVRNRPNSIVARLSGIYGPGRTRMIALAQAISSPYIIKELAFTNRIHVDDGARAILHLINLKDPEDIYCVTDSEPAANHAILTWIREAMSLPPVPPQFVPDETQLPATNKRIMNRRLCDSGFHFLFPTFREGYSKLL